jgi:chemotaxis protein CheC
MKTISEKEKDRILEVINICGGKVASTADILLNSSVQAELPELILEEIYEIQGSVGDTEAVTTVVLLELAGKVSGYLFMLMDAPSAEQIADALTGQKHSHDNLDDTDISALKEMGNIFSGNSLKSLSDFLGVDIFHSPPELVTDLLGAIIDSLVLETGSANESVMLTHQTFQLNKTSAQFRLFFLFNPASTAFILEKTGLMVGESK